MSGISSMPPISSLQRYLTDAHDSLRAKKDAQKEHEKQLSADHKPHEQHRKNVDGNIVSLRK